MSGLFGGGKKATTHATRAMGIDFQGAQYGPVVPVVYGQNKVPGNCIWYGDFQSHAQQQKSGKGGGGGGTTNYTYSASAQMGLCEGPGITLQAVMDGTSIVNLSSINYAFASGAIGQAPWSHLSGSAALGYSLTAIFSFQNLDLGSQASLPNYNYVVGGLKQFGGSLRDANPKDILSDICSDPNHGVNFPYLGDLTQYNNYCVANTLLLSPVYDQQQSANQVLSDLFKYTNTYVYYSEDQLKVVPLGDTAVTGNGVTFTPNVTPIVNLGTDDFLADGSGATITIDRQAPQDNLNLVRVEFKDASNTYHDSAVVAAIDEDIITNGGRSDNSETVNGCTNAATARFIAQNLVQRAFYVRNTYQFKLPWRYCYLEPTDIVTLTDAALGLNLYPVRITEIEEDGESALTITAEEFPEGIGHSAIYNTQPNGGTNIDQNADPGAVNPPYLFRGPGFLIGNNTPEIWCAVNGSDPMWAGCEVYLSHDGSSYTFCGTVASQARYGELTTALPAGTADPDVTHTPTVQVYAPAQLLGGSQTDADNFVTLAMIDTEIVSYETATLAGANTYTLGYLRRGGYGSANVAHSIGADFVRLDDSIFRMPVDPSLIGSTVYLKFLSINAFGRTPRTLAEETAYQYVVGTNVELPDVPDVPASFAVLGVADGVSITWSNDNPAAVGCTSIEYSTTGTSGWTVLAQEGPTTTSFHHGFTNGATYYYRARARGPLPQSGWSAYTDVYNSTGVDVSDIANTANTAQALASQVAVLNPGFDAGDTGWTKGTGWSIKSDGSFGHGAGYAERVGGSDGAIRNNAVCFVQPGHSYKVQALIKAIGANGQCYARISWRDLNDSEIGTTNGDLITGTTVAGSFAVGIPPAGAVFAHAEIAATSHTAGKYQVDNVVSSLQPATADEIAESTSRKFAAESGADVTHRNVAYGPNKIINPGAETGSLYPHIVQDVGAGGTWGLKSSGAAFSGVNVFTFYPAGQTADQLLHLNRDDGAGGFGVDKLPSARAGQLWAFRGRSYLSGSGAIALQFNLRFMDAAGATTGAFTKSITPTGSMADSGYIFGAAPSGTVYVDGYIRVPVGSPATVDHYEFDDFELRTATVEDAGSGVTIGDQRNLLPVTWAGVRSVNSTSPISYTYAWNAAAGLYNISVNVAAYTLYGGTFSVSYAASSLSGTQAASTTQTAYYYYIDPKSAGGSLPLNFTTDPAVLAKQNGVVFIGYGTLTTPAAGGSSGGGTGSGGGGFCVADDMFIGEGRRAGDAEIGDPFDCIDLPTAAGKHVRALQGLTRGVEDCVRLITSDGCALVCSVSTPFDLPDGRNTVAPNMLGEQVITDLGTATVISLALVGPRPVTRAHLGGVSYAAGADPHRRIYSHNAGAGGVLKP